MDYIMKANVNCAYLLLLLSWALNCNVLQELTHLWSWPHAVTAVFGNSALVLFSALTLQPGLLA